MKQRDQRKRVDKHVLIWVAALLAAAGLLTATLVAGGYAQSAVRTVAAVFAPGGGTKSEPPAYASGSFGVISAGSAPVSADVSEPASSGGAGSQGASSADAAEVPFSKPAHVRGVWFYPGVDFLTGSSPDYTSAMAKWDAALADLASYNFNTIILPVNLGDKVIYPDAAGGGYVLGDAEEDLLGAMIKKAHDAGKYVFCVLSMPQDVSMDVLTARVLGAARELAQSDADGLFLRDYHRGAASALYAQYMTSGGGMGLDSFIRDQLTALIKRVSAAVRGINRRLYFGVAAHAVWDTKARSPAGIDGTSDFTAYGTGHADTLGWMNAGLLDCVIVENDRPTQGGGLLFGTVAKWWTAAAKSAGADVIVSHSSKKVEQKASGFLPDQLTKQAIALEGLGTAGSVYDSLSALKNDKTGSTATLIAYYAGKVKSDYILRDLSVTSPSKLTFTTNESALTIRGASDPNFQLTMNGKAVSRSELGYFSFDVKLTPGKNTFRFEHKGKSITYNITYKLIIIREFFPAADQTVRGSTKFVVTAVALKNANVTATLAGTTVKLAPSENGGKDGEEAKESSQTFVTYTGAFQVPAAKTKEQDLGKITFKASHSGQSMTKTGGRVKVRADTYADITGEYAAEVIIEQAETFNGKTNDDYSNPLNSYLPRGTIDYCDPNPVVVESRTREGKKVTLKYHLWRFGKRTYLSNDSSGTNIKVYKAKLPETNTVTAAGGVAKDARHTTLTFDVLWKAPFQLVPEGKSWYSEPNATEPKFAISGSFGSKYVDITFCYAAAGQGVLEFGSDNPVFTRAEWFRNERDYTLRLYLKKAGGLYGWSANYNASGQLVFKFLHPARINAAAAKPLAGTKIVVDPGHGGSDPGAVFAKNLPTEDDLNLTISKKLENKLTAKGAQVLMTRTDDRLVYMRDRAALTREFTPDLFISVHMNAGGGSVRGYENYYFSPFSKRLANAVYNKMKGVPNFASYMRGDKFGKYFVTRISDCPSILTENGFVTNKDEYTWVNSGNGADQIAQATADGILDYFKSIQ